MSQRFERYDRKIFWRDVREILASGVVAAFYGHEALAAADPLTRIGALVVVAGAALVAWRLVRARQFAHPGSADRSRRDRMRAEIEKVGVQIELLESVHRWYLAPLVLGVSLMVAAGGLDGWHEFATLGAVCGAAALVWHLNRREARCSLRPRRRSLVRALDRTQETDVAEVAHASE